MVNLELHTSEYMVVLSSTGKSHPCLQFLLKLKTQKVPLSGIHGLKHLQEFTLWLSHPLFCMLPFSISHIPGGITLQANRLCLIPGGICQLVSSGRLIPATILLHVSSCSPIHHGKSHHG